MNKEFKKITTKNETRYILETATADATSSSAIATSVSKIGELRRRLQELKDKISVPTTKPRNPIGMGSTPGRGTQVHKDKKRDQKQGVEKHRKPFYEQMMEEIENLSELEKPSGSMFLKFRGKRLPEDEMMILAYGGFGTTPKDVTVGNSLIKPFSADNSYDVINKIKKIFKDQDFVGVEKIVLDIPNALSGQLRNVLDYVEQDPEHFELYTGDDSEDPEAKTGGKVIGIGPDGKRIDRTPPKAQIGGSSRGIASTGMVTVQADSTGQRLINGLLSQGKLSRDTKIQGNKITLRKDDYTKMMSVLGNAKFQQIFTKIGSVAEGDNQLDHEISMASNELTSIAKDAANLLDIVRQRSEEEGLEAWQQSKITKAADYMNSVLQSISGDEEQGVAEGSGPKEKQKTPYRDINSPEYRAAADKQKQQMAKDKAAEPGKKLLAKKGMSEAFDNDEANLYYKYDSADGRLKQRMVNNNNERQAFAQGYKDTPEQALKAAGIIRSKFDPKKFIQNQGSKWVQVYPYGKPNTPTSDLEQGVAETFDNGEITPKSAIYILRKMEQGVPMSSILDDFPELYRMMEIIAGEQGLHMDDDFEDIEASLYHDLEDIAAQGNDFSDYDQDDTNERTNTDTIVQALEEVKKGLYYYVNKRKKAGTSRSKNHPKAPSSQDWKNAAKTAKKENLGVDESGLQYYTGKKKYGKVGMTALAKAGRGGASEEELGRIKDRYKKENAAEGKIKGADGKACWKGKRYAGTKNGKDICVPVSEDTYVSKLHSMLEQLKKN